MPLLGKTQKRIDFFHDFSKLIVKAQEKKRIAVLPHCYHRTAEQQRILFEDGKSRVEHSRHQDWLAIDIVIVRDGKLIWNARDPDYEWLGQEWRKMGHKWGGDFDRFKDAVHFEY